MTEDAERGAGPLVVKRWRSRLFDRMTLLLAILVVFISLVGLERIEEPDGTLR